MEFEKAQALNERRAELAGMLPWSVALLEKLASDGFIVNHVRQRPGRPVWFVRAAPPEALQQGFGLAPEVLLVLVRGAMQATDVRAAAEEVIASGLRLDGNLLILADEQPGLAERIERIGGHGQRVALVQLEDGSWPSLEERLRAQLPLFDAYEERDPVRGAQLVGREGEVGELRTRVTRGDAVGLFGLRKMGKTSVMRAVTDWFDPASGSRCEAIGLQEHGNVAVVVDAGVVVERTVDALAEELLAELDRRAGVAGEAPPPRRGSGLVAWKSAMEAVLAGGRRICVVVDEYDLLFEGEGQTAISPIAGLNQIFRLIRGWSQMRQGQVSLVLVGRDSTFLATPEIDGVTNSLLAWCMPMWIGPLSRDKANELLRKVGRRVGLKVGRESTAEAIRATGGHPLLHRQFGSALRGAVRDQTKEWGVDADPYCPAAIARYRSRDAVQEVLRETVALLRKRHNASYSLLRDLAEGYSWDDAMTGYGGAEAEAARTLVKFGIAGPDRPMATTLGLYLREQDAQASSPWRQAG